VTAHYLLDTNTVSYIVSGRSRAARARLESNLAESVISSVTEAELRYGVVRRPEAIKLRKAVESFLAVVSIRAWDSDAAKAYSITRARMTAAGKSLTALDMMIAAHAAALRSVLVTNNNAFNQAGVLGSVNWADDL
jgi:tRNA(fMet)-specific endonuclease VapC